MNRDNLITVGVITSAHGVGGELKVKLLTDYPERIHRLKQVVLISDRMKKTEPRIVATARLAHDRAIIALKGVKNREQAQRLIGYELAVAMDEAVTLPEGHYFYFQLEGLQVYTLQGKYIGILKQVIPLPANDVYVVESISGSEILLPATREVVRKIDLELGYMEIHLLPGLG
ncbi:MAG TPA: ribosome maturation factor RimM [bacterium]|nr:ribosome maturation factor RimM [bacterium]